MHKKALKTIPLPRVCIDRIHDIAAGNKDIRGVIISQKKNAPAEETLILNVYQVSGKNKKDISLLFRVFCQKNDYITFDADCNKWRTGALLHLICRDSGWCQYWWSYSQLKFLTDRDAKRVESTLRRWNHNNAEHGERAAFILFDQYQQNVKNARLMKKHKKETDAIDADMDKFGGLPDDYRTFIEEKVFRDENYIFYDTGKKRAYCTGCKKTFILENKHLRHETISVRNDQDDVKHNRTVRCPCCNKFLMAKSEGMSRQSLVSVMWSVLVQPYNEEVLVRYFCHTKDFQGDFHSPVITTKEGYRTVHRADKSTDYMWARFKSTRDIRWCYYRGRNFSWNRPAETVEPRSVVMYNTNLQETLAGTCMKYSAADIYINKAVCSDGCRILLSRPWTVDFYFNQYRKKPYLEQIVKVGFYKLAGAVMDDYECPDFVNGKTVMETLGINKQQFNMLRAVGNPSLRDVMILRYAGTIRQQDFDMLRAMEGDQGELYKKFLDMRQYTTIHRVIKYMDKKSIERKLDYFDYIRWLREMGYDMHNEFNLFPKNFHLCG